MTANGIVTIPGGGVTSAKGFLAGATCAGLKTRGEEKLDLGIVCSEAPCVGAGVFTTNAVVSPGVTLTRERVSSGRVRGVIVNSGCANACVGPQGLTDAREMSALAAAKLGVSEDEVLVASTGIIGVELPMSLLRGAVDRIELSRDGGPRFARAIMTTDSHPKEAAVSFEIDGTTCTIGAVVKGVGMINPNMATLLCFIATDAAVEPGFLREALLGTINVSLNMVTIDGDSSTNDSTVILANGAAGNTPIRAETNEADLFRQALTEVCIPLTKMVAKDGEGATKLIEVTVEEAATIEDARRAAKTVASSLLVKAAVHGADPNWGRVAMALGRSGARVQEETLSLYMNEICVFDVGAPIPFFKDVIVASMMEPEIKIPSEARRRRAFGNGLGLRSHRRIRALQQRVYYLMPACPRGGVSMERILVKVGGNALGDGDTTVDDLVDLQKQGHSPRRRPWRRADDHRVAGPPRHRDALRRRHSCYRRTQHRRRGRRAGRGGEQAARRVDQRRRRARRRPRWGRRRGAARQDQGPGPGPGGRGRPRGYDQCPTRCWPPSACPSSRRSRCSAMRTRRTARC